MKRIISVLLSVIMLLGVFSAAASAEPGEQTYGWGFGGWGYDGTRVVSANFYLLNEGLTVPVGTASQPAKNYVYAGTGRIKIDRYNPNGYYNAEGNGLAGRIVEAPSIELEEGQSIIWYVIKYEDDGWHVDGVITPFCSVLYDSNSTSATGSTTDEKHYYKGDSATVKANGFVRGGYKFVGWNTSADGTGTSYNEGDVIASENLSFAKNMNTVTLYAIWEKLPETDPTPEKPENSVVKGGIVCPKKMSVRFEDGTIYYGGESIELEIGKEYKFQMCSNNWDNDTYNDEGDGICGTVVYTVRVSDRYDERSYDEQTKTFVLPKGDPVLRTDVNRCFMAYRYHFKTDYNKQTGIKQVVNTPLESLSVNLPLGSTVKSDAYIAYEHVGSADVFVENNEDLTISYTDYMWSY